MAIGHWNPSVIDLIPSYRNTKRNLEQAKESASKSDKETIGSMISDCDYALEWLHTGRRPGNRRGIERRAAYQRERLIDPVLIQSLSFNSTAGSPANLSDTDRKRIENALGRLTDRERDCFLMSVGQCIPLSEIAMMMSLTKSTVQGYVESAKKKMKEHAFQGDLFDLI